MSTPGSTPTRKSSHVGARAGTRLRVSVIPVSSPTWSASCSRSPDRRVSPRPYGECALSAALAEPLCPAGAAPQLEHFAITKLQRALELVRNAALAGKPKRRQRLLAKASKVLGKIVRHEPGATTDDCLELLTARIDDVRDTLLELRTIS